MMKHNRREFPEERTDIGLRLGVNRMEHCPSLLAPCSKQACCFSCSCPDFHNDTGMRFFQEMFDDGPEEMHTIEDDYSIFGHPTGASPFVFACSPDLLHLHTPWRTALRSNGSAAFADCDATAHCRPKCRPRGTCVAIARYCACAALLP